MTLTDIFKKNRIIERKKEIAIDINNISKSFKIFQERPTTIYDRLFKPNQKYELYNVLKNINISIEKGDFVGIIGKNGCGKSTLLRIIANILHPTEGSVKINGSIASILELGVGFNQELSAEENIRLYASIMGVPKKKIDETVVKAIEFADLKRFRDTKVKNYSSGMYARLAFSTAVQVDPEILLVDEILAVGDLEFQQKCFNVFLDYKKKRKTIIFVSHDLNTVRRFCDKVLLLEQGKQIVFGETNEIIEKYMNLSIKNINDSIEEKKLDKSIERNVEEIGEHQNNKNDDKENIIKEIIKDIEIIEVVFLNKNDIKSSTFKTNDLIKIRIFYKSYRIISNPVFGIIIHDEKGNWCIGMNTYISKIEIRNLCGESYIDLIIPKLQLNKGRYSVSAAIAEKNAAASYDYRDKAYEFNVINVIEDYGIFIPEYRWSIDKVIQDI